MWKIWNPIDSANILYKLHPQDEWRQGVIQMRDNYEHKNMHCSNCDGDIGRPGKMKSAVERMAAQFLKIGIGDSVIFKIDDKERVLPITGLIRHPFVPPPQFMDLAFFFMNGDGMERLGIPTGKFSSVLCACYAIQCGSCKRGCHSDQRQAGKTGYQCCRVSI